MTCFLRQYLSSPIPHAEANSLHLAHCLPLRSPLKNPYSKLPIAVSTAAKMSHDCTNAFIVL